MKGKFSLTVVVCLFLISVARAQSVWRIDEAEIKAVSSANQLRIDFPADNPAQSFSAAVRLEILDADDKILAQTETAEFFKRGRQIIKIPLDFAQKPENANDLLRCRLRYSFVRNDSPQQARGIVSLSEILPELFELQITAAENVYAGMKLRAHVLAVHPLTKKPIKNVSIKGEVALDLAVETDGEDALKISAKGSTNSEGFVSLDFEIPSGAKLDDDGEIEIVGEKNGITRRAEEDLDVAADARIYLTLDKPIYQPNQKLYVRGLYLNPGRRPAAEREIEMEIRDETDTAVYEKTLKTSRFGVASFEWQIPKDIKLGTYRIKVENGDSDDIGESEFKITRYDLPNFTVNAAADRAFYLPEQKTAEVSVSADYLFGKPVTNGTVRVVEERERSWNYAQQKWETAETNSQTGATDAAGRYTARIDLSEAQEHLRRDNWKRFEDLHFAAYFTDATTNRTEVKRFDVRVSKEAIHIYLLRYFEDVNPQMPFEFYVSTFYADGTPARCEIEIKSGYQNTPDEKNTIEAKTNADGAGKLTMRLPEKPFPSVGSRYYVQISARDRQGSGGTFADSFYLNENLKQVRVTTDKTIYTPNETVEASIYSTEKDELISLDVVSNSTVVYSKRIKAQNGREIVRIPYRAEFKGELTLTAYFRDESGYYRNLVKHSKTIVFPVPSDLKFNLKSLKDVYRPNERAKISFNVRGSQGAAETALGVVVFDKAIEERARAEKVADNYTDLRRLLGTADSFGSWTRRDLNNLDASKPISADWQLAAEFLLINKNYEPRFFESDSYTDDFGEIFKDYFAVKLQPLEAKLKAHYEKTGEFPMDETSLRRITAANNLNFGELRDAWETPYKIEFRPDRNFTTLILKTASADKKFGTEDDFTAKEMRYDWFAPPQNRLTTALNNYTAENKPPPQTVDELKAVWQAAGIDFDALRDNYNQPLYLTTVNYTRTAEKSYLEIIGNLNGESPQIVRTKIVSQDVILFKIRSAGADGAKLFYDDFDLGSLTIVTAERDLKNAPPLLLATISKSATSEASGAVTGTLLDATGAVVPGIIVTAFNQSSSEVFSAASNDEGVYLLAKLPSGKYQITAEGQSGFARSTIENVVVSAMNLIKLDIYLQVGGATATVDVTAGAEIVNSTNSSLSATRSENAKSISAALNAARSAPNSTPRVREYFPETLLWQPELVTSKKGGATIEFKLADSLTTWKLYAVASTESGEIGLAEREIKTFQPFFAELDPPKILTEGDEIKLPVPVRNYTDKRQPVAVSMRENGWSKLRGAATQQIEIAPNSSQNAIFDVLAASPVEDGKQQVTALADGDGDAIEKTVTVKPNGRETVQLKSRLFRENAGFDVAFPADSFPKTRRAAVKIYPNLLAHVAESVEGLLKRPYGCGEQTTSSTYPNLLILKIEKDTGKPVNKQIKEQAQIYLRDGYERLLNYQTPSGGFSYWGKTDQPNVALTAYILRFLNDAKDFIEVDGAVIGGAQTWLLQQQTSGSRLANQIETDGAAAYVARSLSLDAGKNEGAKKSLQLAAEHLKKRLPEIKDAYVLANFALAAIETNDVETAQIIAAKLNSMAQTDGETLFWATANTPFYGWGTTAKIETTALVVQVLARLNAAGVFDNSIARGTAFLLTNKDRHGVWFSTQTTVNVLDALILLQKSAKSAAPTGSGGRTEIYINGAKVREYAIDANALADPLYFDASPYLTETTNRVEIKNVGSADFTQAQIVAAYYTAWKEAAPEDARYFDLKINFDRTDGKIGDEITGAVTIARKEGNRYGMLLAEIGTPPGADVDRSSLERMKNQNVISRYDVLPDRIIVYLWAGSAPVSFDFKFKPRYGINAQTAPSMVYDYYNAEAQTTVAPVRFSIK